MQGNYRFNAKEQRSLNRDWGIYGITGV